MRKCWRGKLSTIKFINLIYKRGCLIRAQETQISIWTTMKVWKLVFLVILSVHISVMDQTRPTLWILVKNWGFFSSFTKISWFSTFTWVIPKKYRKKTVQFSFGHRIAIYASIFKKLVSFDIGKVWPIWIRQNSWGPMIFRWSKSEICKKMDPIFCNFSKISPEASKTADFVFIHDEFEKARIWGYEKWSIFWILKYIWRFGNYLKNEQFFFNGFYSITHVIVA